MPAPRTLTGHRSGTPNSSAVLVLLVATVVACSNVPVPTIAPASTQGAVPVTSVPTTPIPAVTGSAAPGPPVASTPTAAPAGPALVGAAIDALARTRSYRLVLSAREGRTSDRYEILTVNKPSSAWSGSLESTAGIVRAIVIADRGWVDRGSGSWARTNAAEAGALVGIDAVDGVLDAFDDPDLERALRFAGREEHNGTPADRYQATPRAGGVVDVWIAPEGHLVALSSSGWPATDDVVQVEISDVDDPANVIEPPS